MPATPMPATPMPATPMPPPARSTPRWRRGALSLLVPDVREGIPRRLHGVVHQPAAETLADRRFGRREGHRAGQRGKAAQQGGVGRAHPSSRRAISPAGTANVRSGRRPPAAGPTGPLPLVRAGRRKVGCPAAPAVPACRRSWPASRSSLSTAGRRGESRRTPVAPRRRRPGARPGEDLPGGGYSGAAQCRWVPPPVGVARVRVPPSCSARLPGNRAQVAPGGTEGPPPPGRRSRHAPRTAHRDGPVVALPAALLGDECRKAPGRGSFGPAEADLPGLAGPGWAWPGDAESDTCRWWAEQVGVLAA